jgi:hypothetical protein
VTLITRAAVALGLALVSCSHGERFAVPDYGSDVPLAPGAPLRLTYSAGPDYDASWLPDGSAVLYTSAQPWRDDDDECLAVLPPSGGQADRVLCENATVTRDSTNQWIAAAASPGGRLAYMRTSRRIGAANPLTSELFLARLDSAGGLGRSHVGTFTVPEFRPFLGVSNLTWLGENALVYRGNFEGNLCEFPGSGCLAEFVRSGRGLVFVPAFAPALTRALPGTAYASSVTRGANDDEIYFTLGGDSRVYRQTVSTGATAVVYDFVGTVVRDVQVRGSRLVAITGGDYNWQGRGSDGFIQFDRGGALMVVDLGAPFPVRLTADTVFVRRPALSPDGTRVVAEWKGDLWLFTIP